MSAYTRRLPIYLLLDCSESMAGDAIAELGKGVDAMLASLRSDPMALESACLSVITFSNTAKQVVPLTEVLAFQPPRLSVRTGSALGAALRLVKQCIQREVRKTTANTKGDYKALVILFTDGEPTDDWEQIADDFKRDPAIANVYAIACGPDADTDMLRSVTDIVLRMTDMAPAAWRKVFVWLSASVQSTSLALESGREGQSISLPPLPDELEIAPKSMGVKDPRPRQVFLYARCSKTRKPYLMRYARRPQGDSYVPLCTHPLEEHEDDNKGSTLAPVNSMMLEGCPGCAYCGNPVAVVCDCGGLFCASPEPGSTTICPHCKQQGTLAAPDTSGRGFDVRQRKG